MKQIGMRMRTTTSSTGRRGRVVLLLLLLLRRTILTLLLLSRLMMRRAIHPHLPSRTRLIMMRLRSRLCMMNMLLLLLLILISRARRNTHPSSHPRTHPHVLAKAPLLAHNAQPTHTPPKHRILLRLPPRLIVVFHTHRTHSHPSRVLIKALAMPILEDRADRG